MALDPFYLKTEKETSDILKIFWEDTEYLMKIRILLKIFEGYSITKLEARNINKLWKSLSLEKQKDVYQSQHKYQI
ncbi:hypothetical protein ES705_47942 [subsurface metagenome]